MASAAGCRAEDLRVHEQDVRHRDEGRRAGEDLKAGAAAIAAGKLLRPAELGIVASLGVAAVGSDTWAVVKCSMVMEWISLTSLVELM